MDYPIDFPAKAVTNERLTLSTRQSVTESNSTYSVQVVNTAAQWQLAWNWPRMRHNQAEYVHGWILSLKGQIGSFRYYPQQAVASTLSGCTLAVEDYAYNESVSVAGFAANSPTTLRIGQFFQIGSQLLAITQASMEADASGNATISVAPMLRLDYAAGTSVNFVNPCGVFRLNASADVGFTLDTDRAPEFSAMAAREVVDA